MSDLMTRKKAHTYDQYHEIREDAASAFCYVLLGLTAIVLFTCSLGAAPLP